MGIWTNVKSLLSKNVEENGETVLRKYYVGSKTKELELDGKYRVFFQIIAIRDFTLANGDTIKKGTKGGWVESNDSLSHLGSCWIDASSIVTEDSKVIEDAYVMDTTIGVENLVSGKSVIERSILKSKNKISDAHIQGSTIGDSSIHGNCVIRDSKVFHLNIQGKENLFDKAFHCSLNRVNIYPYTGGKLNNIATGYLLFSCDWTDVDICFEVCLISAKTNFENVKMSKVYLDIETEVVLENVVVQDDSTLVSPGHGEDLPKQEIKGDSFHPIEILGTLILSGNLERGNFISGSVRFDGIWRLSECSIHGAASLISDSQNQINLKESTLTDVSSLIIQSENLPDSDMLLEKIVLSTDDSYIIS